MNYKPRRGRPPVEITKRRHEPMSTKYAQYYATAQMKLHKSNLYHNRSMQARDTERFCRNREKKIPSLITKGACVWHEGDRNRTNWLVSDLNLELNSTRDGLVRVRAMPLRHACSTDSVKISLLIYIIIDLQRALLQCSLLL